MFRDFNKKKFLILGGLFLFVFPLRTEDFSSQINSENKTQLQQEEKEEFKEISEEEKENILQNAKIYNCKNNDINDNELNKNNEETIWLAITETGSLYLYLNGFYKKLPIIMEEINLENTQLDCNDDQVIIEYKKPFSNKIQKYVFSIKDKNKEINLVGVEKKDQVQEYIDEIFKNALEGKKNTILELNLKEIPFAYQYINSEMFSYWIEEAISKAQITNFNKSKLILESVAILTSKMIYFYYLNQPLNPEETFEDYKIWINAWEYIGWEKYEKFFIKYNEILLKLNLEKGIEIINYLIEKKPLILENYILLGNYYWNKNEKEKAIEIYSKLINIWEENQEFFLLEENSKFQIPHYIKDRLKKYTPYELERNI